MVRLSGCLGSGHWTRSSISTSRPDGAALAPLLEPVPRPDQDSEPGMVQAGADLVPARSWACTTPSCGAAPSTILAPRSCTNARNLTMHMLAGMRTCTSVIMRTLHAKSLVKNAADHRCARDVGWDGTFQGYSTLGHDLCFGKWLARDCRCTWPPITK